MARPLRLKFPGALYHVTSRGNGCADISLDDGHRQAFLDVLATVCHRLHWLYYTYCLMTNHDHVVIETPDSALAEGIRHLWPACRRSCRLPSALTRSRRAAMAAAYVSGAYTLKAIAAYFGVHSSTVSRAIRRAEGQQPA